MSTVGKTCAEKIEEELEQIGYWGKTPKRKFANLIDSEHEKAVAPLVEALRRAQQAIINPYIKSNLEGLDEEIDAALAQASQKGHK